MIFQFIKSYRYLFINAFCIFIFLSACNNKNNNDSNTIRQLDGTVLSYEEVDSIVLSVMKLAKVPGIQLAIFNDKQPKYIKSYGFGDSLKTIPVDNNTVWPAASLSKSMFACVVMKLVEEGRFDLDKLVYQYLDYPMYELENNQYDYLDLKDDVRYKKITGRMLLTHTAGFRNYRWLGNGKLEIYFEPGTQYHYSGEGIILLQSIIEHITKTDLITLSEEYLFSPLKMNRTSYVWKDEFEGNATRGFNSDETAFTINTYTTASAASSSVTTISDFSKLLTAILNNELLNQDLNESMISAQHRIRTRKQFGSDAFIIQPNNTNEGVELSYGLGWGIIGTPSGPAFFKEGNDPGVQNISIIFTNGIGLVLFTNSDNGSKIFQHLNEKLIGNTYFPWNWEYLVPYYISNINDELFEMILNDDDWGEVMKRYKELRFSYQIEEYEETLFLLLGVRLLEVDRVEESIKLFRLTVTGDPSSTLVHFLLGEAYMANGDDELAIASYEKSLELNPHNSKAAQKLKKMNMQNIE